MQINFTNFIRFYTNTVEDETVTLPRLALIDNKVYCPVFVSGETAAFYINANVPFLDGDDINNLELRILKPDGTWANNLGVILQQVVLTSGYRLYASFVMPVLANSQYQFQIFNTSTNTPKCISNWFQTLDIDTADSITASVVWRNSRSQYYYDWQSVPDLYCRIRLHLSLQSYTPEGTVEQLQSVNSGRRRNLNRTVDKSVKLQTYYFDDGANDACIALFEADDIQINGKSYLAKTIYIPNARSNSKVSLGEIELYEQDFSTVNKYGQLPIPTGFVNQGYISFWNKSEIVFHIKTYLENNVLFSSVDVAAGGTKYFPITLIPANGRVDFVPATVQAFDVLTANVVNGVPTFAETVQNGAVVASLNRTQIYNADWFIVIGGATIESVPITMNLTEQAVPFVDSNGQLKVGGVEQFTLNSTATRTINVPVGSVISTEAFTQNASTGTDPILTQVVKNNGVTIPGSNTNTPAVPGASMLFGFTAESGGVYEIDITGTSA